MTTLINGKGRISHSTLLLFTLFRCLFFGIILYFIDSGFTLGTPLGLMTLSGIAGIIIAALLGNSRLRLRGFLTALTLCVAIFFCATTILTRLPVPGEPQSLSFYAISSHLKLLFIVFAVLLTSTWAQVRSLHATTLEMLLFISFVVYLLSGHREFQLDRPHIINTLAWNLNILPQALLTALGTVLALITISYLYLAHLITQKTSEPTAIDSTPRSLSEQCARLILVVAGVLTLVLAVSSTFYERYQTLASTRLMNGVGQAEGSGTSPLGFHSSLGATSQPAGVVRLESDYTTNPFSPMLYLREAALSALGSREMEIASGQFDRDVARINPGQHYFAEDLPSLEQSREVTTSVYLISEHKKPFTIGVPTSYTPIKNPEPARFKQTYKSVSLAPAYKLSALAGQSVGDVNWTQEEWEHYLKPHEDPRYWEYAQKITGHIEGASKVELAGAIATYLSKTSTYTLTPNHEVAPDEDPVAPYLFGDLRGYCVHFAHASVYMLRSLGIPARIGTGYLTDFSQAKDGHILLRQSDRHAWAEVYIQGAGWVPFDTQPEKVESHADTQVDKNLLEELMGLLEPSEEILPDVDPKEEPGLEAPQEWSLPDSSTFVPVLVIALLLFIMAKAYLRFGYLLPGVPQRRLRRLYAHCASALVDLGHPRNPGETRMEYVRRGAKYLREEAVLATTYLLAAEYGNSSATFWPKEIPARGLIGVNVRWWRKVLAFFNPTSLILAIQRRF